MILASPKIWDLQGNLGFTFTTSWNGLSGPPCRNTPELCQASVNVLSHGGRVHNNFIVSLTLKSKPCDWNYQDLVLVGVGDCWVETWLPHSITSSPVFWLSLAKPGCPGICLIHQPELKLRYLPASVFWVLIVKVYTTTQGSKLSFNSFSQVGNLAEWDLVLRSPLPLFYFLICVSPWKHDLTPFHFLVPHFSSNCTFCIFPFSACSFFIIDLHKSEH